MAPGVGTPAAATSPDKSGGEEGGMAAVDMSVTSDGSSPVDLGGANEERVTSNALKKQSGGLLRLFQSECFDSYFHMFYLFKREDQGVHDYLVNLLYRRPDEEIHFYLPQLCQLSIVRMKTSALPKFLLDKAAKSMHLALKSNWFFQAAFEDKIPDLSDAANKMREEIEMAGVNSLPFSSRDSSSELNAHANKLSNAINVVRTPDLFLRRRAIRHLGKTKKNQNSFVAQRALQLIQYRFPEPPAQAPDTIIISTTTTGPDDNSGGCSGRTANASPPASPQTSPAASPTPTLSVAQQEPEGPLPSPPLPSPIPVVSAPPVEESTASSPDPTAPPTSAPNVEASPNLDKGSRGRRSSRKGRIAPGFVSNTGSVSLQGSRVKFTSVYYRLGPPFNYTSFSRESHGTLLEDSDMQQFIIKQRRCEYFNLVGQFISMIIEVSDKLVTEPERSLRVPLLVNWLKSLDEWILCRRCIVAASEGIFAMTGLLIPFTHFGVEPERATLGVPTPFRAPFLVHPTPSPQPIQTSQFSSVQMLQVVYEACKVFSSKKRAPYLLVFELADLDEDLVDLMADDVNAQPRTARTSNASYDDLKLETTVQSQSAREGPRESTNEASLPLKKEITWDTLHVFNAILQDLKNRQLFIPSFCTRPLTIYELERIEDVRNRDVSCHFCYPSDPAHARASSTPPPLDGSSTFPFECPACKGTKVFYEAIHKDNKLLALRRSLGVPTNPHPTTGAHRVPNVPPYDPARSSAPYQDLVDADNEAEVPQTEVFTPMNNNNVQQQNVSMTPIMKTSSVETGKGKGHRRSSIFTTLGLAPVASNRSRSVGRGETEPPISSEGPPVQPRGRQPLIKRSSSVDPSPNGRSSSVTAQPLNAVAPINVGLPQARGISTGPSAAPASSYKRSQAALPSIANIFGVANVLGRPALKQSPSQSTPAKCSPSAPSQTDLSQPVTPSLPEAPAGYPPLWKEGETVNEQASRVRQIIWGELWDDMKDRIRMKSPYGNLKSWKLGAVIVKGGDDLRQELLASQLVLQFKAIFDEAKLPLYLRPYEILVTGAHSGIMEFITDTQSIDAIKKKFNVDSIAKVFDAAFADNPAKAKRNFIESHAAYSLIGYFLQVRDRHNGNLLLDAVGHIIHIDYGYMLANSPGSMGFETSPFKLSAELLAIMDGESSEHFENFKELIVKGFLETRKHADRILLVVEMMLSASKMPCFAGNPEAACQALKDRFMLGISDTVCISKILDLVEASVNNWRTAQYDNFQKLTNGIM